MGIQEEIFEGFFKKLEGNENFPNSIVAYLKKLHERGEIASQERIFEVIKKVFEDASEDQKD